MKLATILSEHGHQIDGLSNDQRQAFRAIVGCRTNRFGSMATQCTDCPHIALRPHSCGHRACPTCLNHCTSLWLDRQAVKLLPCDYFMVTFTLPAQWRPIARRYPRIIYDTLMDCAASTLKTFAKNDPNIGSRIGMTAVLHTHTRSKDYHPHVHLVIPSGGLSDQRRLWQRKQGNYLFNARALAKVFRARMLQQLAAHGIRQPSAPTKWVAHCQRVGAGLSALKYLSRYLYRGVMPEKDIMAAHNGQITFRYRDNKSKKQTVTLPATQFIKLVLQHVLPKGFRRVRDYGFLHGNARETLKRVQWALKVHMPDRPPRPRPVWRCQHCGGEMQILSTKIKRVDDG